jgi:hypothetical protein
VLVFTLKQLTCRDCGRTWSPFAPLLGLVPRQRIAEELVRKMVEGATELSYAKTCDLAGAWLGASVTPRTLHRFVQERGAQLRFTPAAPTRVVVADGTKVPAGPSERGVDVRLSFQILGRHTEHGRVVVEKRIAGWGMGPGGWSDALPAGICTFNPNVGNPVQAGAGTGHWNWYGNYYPGDAYVDYVGAHGFNAPRVWGGRWTGFDEMFDGARADHILSDLVTRYPGKPIIVGEFATDEGAANAKAQWIGDAYLALLNHPNVVGAVWFNMDKEADWRIESSPAAEAAFRAAMAEPRIRVSFDASASTAPGSLAAR